MVLNLSGRMNPIAVNAHITGIVQGVGFRPFVYNQAIINCLTGWVRNTSAGVDIHIEGHYQDITAFLNTFNSSLPPLAKIDSFSTQPADVEGFSEFKIINSEPIPDAYQPISPDVCICDDCLKEMFDPSNRRFRYPFINCTNCGPRYTIIKNIPYDRPLTTMEGFRMCEDCLHEYEDPLDRRFHAQPIACPVCGPQAWLEIIGNPNIYHQDQAIRQAQTLLQSGSILAIKGLGGFHLACDASNESAVLELRRRKLRVDKPFALMMPDLHCVEKHCLLDDNSRKLLTSLQRPIVILARKTGSAIASAVAPGQKTIGVMLPYTPLHYLLFASNSACTTTLELDDLCLVMTSGNLCEEPIATDNNEARIRLHSLVDGFLFHDRPIQIRCDDSVVRCSPTKKNYFFRRSRSYTPFPIYLPITSPPLLATGSELKNTFCLTREKYAVISHHIGDMENFETLQSFEQGIDHFEKLFRVCPELIACDLHPDYLATRYAQARSRQDDLPLIQVQHHHAHIAACMADNKLDGTEPVIGIAFDGTGYGIDNRIWGGEFFVGDYRELSRVFHLCYLPLPGGDQATRKPARIALAYAWCAGDNWDNDLPCYMALSDQERHILKSQLEHQINTPITSSMGRLFDAVASLANVRHENNYEAQAAIEMEALVDTNETRSYPFEIIHAQEESQGQINVIPIIKAVRYDALQKTSPSIIAARFHNTIALIVLQTAQLIRQQTGINRIVLSGGVWQNYYLLHQSHDMLTKDNFVVYTHSQVPTNDGGIALGQAVVAAFRARA